MSEEKKLELNKESIDVLVTSIIPTTKYFESRFDHMQYQIDEIKESQKSMLINMDKRFEQVDERFNTMQQNMDNRFNTMQQDMDKRFNAMQQDMDKRFNAMQQDMDKRFEKVDKRFEQVDKRFEQVDKRFEQVDKRFNDVTDSIHLLTLRIEELAKSQETTIRDYIIERDRHYDMKFNNLRIFNITIITLVAGVILKMAGVVHLG